MRPVRVAALLVALTLAPLLGLTGRGASSTLPQAREPGPLRGVPLRGETGLRLLVAGNPPFVLDVDTGETSSLPGVVAVDHPLFEIVGVAGRAGVVLARSVWPRADLHAVRARGSRVAELGTGWNVWAAGDGRGVWVQRFVDRSRCTLRRVALDGRLSSPPRPSPCASASDPAGGSLGLVVNRTRVRDPLTGRTVLRTRWGILAVAGGRLVLAGPGRQFTLLDASTRAERRLPWPSIITTLDQPAVDPRGRLVALAFANPAWRGMGAQALDVWLLDTGTGELTQLPGMPVFLSLKRTSMAWTDDGRLVFLGESNGRDFVAVWRPGWRRLALKTVHLPEGAGGSFAPLR
jgi:hypothetical protein